MNFLVRKILQPLGILASVGLLAFAGLTIPAAGLTIAVLVVVGLLLAWAA